MLLHVRVLLPSLGLSLSLLLLARLLLLLLHPSLLLLVSLLVSVRLCRRLSWTRSLVLRLLWGLFKWWRCNITSCHFTTQNTLIQLE